VRSRFHVCTCRVLLASALVLAVFTSTPAQAKEHDEDSPTISGFAVIDRVITPGAEPVFRADGYTLRLTSATAVRFSGGLSSLSEVGTNIWVRYEGAGHDFGEIVLSSAEFIQPHLHKPKRNPKESVAQVTAFPFGSFIDFDGTFHTDASMRKGWDAGGGCDAGWHPVPEDAALQERVRRIGLRVVPQYQRDLPDDDPAKIPFRFYAVEENHIRSGLGCEDGLVMIPVPVIARMQNDSQLAAVLADTVAAELQQQDVRLRLELKVITVVEAASELTISLGGWTAGAMAMHSVHHRMQEQRGRMAIVFMADAGFDPWQAPETWRRLAPAQLPPNLSKVKYPARSIYQFEILRLLQYKRAATAATPQITSRVVAERESAMDGTRLECAAENGAVNAAARRCIVPEL
jgi:hypothetical protein